MSNLATRDVRGTTAPAAPTELRSTTDYAASVGAKAHNAAARLDRLTSVLFGAAPSQGSAGGNVAAVPNGLYGELRQNIEGTESALDAVHTLLDRLEAFA